MKQVVGTSQVAFSDIGEWGCIYDLLQGEVVPFCTSKGFEIEFFRFVRLPSLLLFEVFALLPPLKTQVSSFLFKIVGFRDKLLVFICGIYYLFGLN